jgi:CRISPR-associated protein Csm5
MATTTYTLTCLSPVHVGSGRRWTKFDGAYEGQRWHVIDLDRALARGVDPVVLTSDMNARDFAWAQCLGRDRLSASEVAVYSLPCPDDPGDVLVREHLKNIDLLPYLPGSTVKGAVRTALLWHLMQYLNVADWSSKLHKKRESLAQPVEQAFLGKTQNQDLLRTLRVGDSSPADPQTLGIGLVWTYTCRDNRLVEKRERGSEFKVYVEWLPPGTQLTTSIQLDEYLFQPAADAQLHFSGPREQAVRQLAPTCNGRARALIQGEQAFFAAHQLPPLQSYYVQLEETLDQLGPGSFLLNIGWGGGWEVKTVGDLVQQALGDERWHQLREKFGLGRKPSTRQIDWQAPFPKTRRLAYDAGKPFSPLGWLLLSPLSEEVPYTALVSAAMAHRQPSQPAAPTGPAVLAQPPGTRRRPPGTRVRVTILAPHEKGGKGAFFVQEEGKPKGILSQAKAPAMLPEVGAEVDVFINSDDSRSPQYRWDAPSSPRPPRGRDGAGPQRRGRR